MTYPILEAEHQKADRCYFCHKAKERNTTCECRRAWTGQIRVIHADGTRTTYYPKRYGIARLMAAYYETDADGRPQVVFIENGPALYDPA
jgi:hypothetical protein